MGFESNPVRWGPPEGLSYSGPRPVRLSRQGLVLVCLGGIFGLCASIIGPMAFRAIHSKIERDRLLSKDGVVAAGTVTRVWKESGKTETPMVSYRFTASDREFIGQSQMRTGAWRGIQPGDPLVVRYLPSQPKVNQPAQGVPNPPPEWLAWMPALMFVWPPIVFWFMIRAQWRLLADGVPVRAVVTRINRSKKINAHYEFKIPAGTSVRGKSPVSRRSVPDVGAQVCVLYNPENPRKNSLYPLEMVKLETE